jgi:hypothetical protein
VDADLGVIADKAAGGGNLNDLRLAAPGVSGLARDAPTTAAVAPTGWAVVGCADNTGVFEVVAEGAVGDVLETMGAVALGNPAPPPPDPTTPAIEPGGCC